MIDERPFSKGIIYVGSSGRYPTSGIAASHSVLTDRDRMMVRKKILVPRAIDGRIRRLARQKGISPGALVVAAIEALPDSPEQVEHILAFARVIDDAPTTLSEDVDVVLYG